MYHLNIPTHVTLGSGCRRAVAETLAGRGWRRVGVVRDHGLEGDGLVDELVASIAAAGAEVVPVACAVREPTYDALDAARRTFDGAPPPDVMVGIGGGSALDMAKAMAVLVHNRQPAIAYRGFDRATEPVLPIVAVPTTAGTGSEVTPNASFVDSAEKRKLGINGEAVRPAYAFLDAELTLGCPPEPTVSAGVDSLVHATEAFVAGKSNPLARVFAADGFARVAAALPGAVARGDDLAARREVMLGAFLSGLALMHSGTGPAAAMSYPLGVHFAVPHGVGGAIFLPHVVRHNAEAGCPAYAGLHDALAGADIGLDAVDKGLALAQRLEELWSTLDVPRDLAGLGVGAADVGRFVADTLELGAALEQNPVPFGEAEVRATLGCLGVEAAP